MSANPYLFSVKFDFGKAVYIVSSQFDFNAIADCALKALKGLGINPQYEVTRSSIAEIKLIGDVGILEAMPAVIEEDQMNG